MSSTPTPSDNSKNSFDYVDSLIPVPESSRKKKLVKLGAKVLETKKQVRKVLPEEQYCANLEKIIVRDYFPELPKMKAQAEFLEAVARNDHLKIRELQIRYSTRRTDRRTSPSQRPKSPSSTFDSESPCPSAADNKDNIKKDRQTTDLPYANTEGDNDVFLKERKKKKTTTALDKLNVQSYLENYTSEDNASFEELFELYHKRERVKNAWMYEAEKKHNESLVYRGPEMVQAADEQLVAKKNEAVERPIDVDNWSYKARNVVLFNHMDEAPLTMEEHIERAKCHEMAINKEATRYKNEQQKLPHQAAMARAAFQNVAKIAGHVDISGKQVGVEAKMVDLVATPTPAPGIEDSPLMTWGEIEGTPFRLDAPEIQPSIEDAPTFRIPEMPVREKIAQGIAEQIATRYHDKRKHAMNQIQQFAPKTPKFSSIPTSGRLAKMSPAARNLLNDRLGIRLSTDKIKVSPSPKGTPARTIFSPAIYKMVKVKNEPKSGASTPSRATTPSALTITDNLLRIPSSPGPSSTMSGQPEHVQQAENNDDEFEQQQSESIGIGRRPVAADFF